MHDAKKGSVNLHVESARGTAHPPVIQSLALKPNQGVLPAGLILKTSNDGLIPLPDGDTAIFGVLDMEVDTAISHVGLVIVHGSVRREILCLADDETPGETTIAALIEKGVYPE